MPSFWVQVMLCHSPIWRQDHEEMLLRAVPSFNSQYQLLLLPELMMPKYWVVPLLSSNAQEKLLVLLPIRWSTFRLTV